MQHDNFSALWEALREQSLNLAVSKQAFEAARIALVSRLCECYREGEDWEDRAIWCTARTVNRCPYFLELRKQSK